MMMSTMQNYQILSGFKDTNSEPDFQNYKDINSLSENSVNIYTIHSMNVTHNK
jgi:hypothetical protein